MVPKVKEMIREEIRGTQLWSPREAISVTRHRKQHVGMKRTSELQENPPKDKSFGSS